MIQIFVILSTLYRVIGLRHAAAIFWLANHSLPVESCAIYSDKAFVLEHYLFQILSVILYHLLQKALVAHQAPREVSQEAGRRVVQGGRVGPSS